MTDCACKGPGYVCTRHCASESSTPAVKSDGGASSYYLIPEGAKELMDLIEFRNMGFSIGNIFKACYRLGSKDGTTRAYDLRKIIYFAQRELDRLG
jgi:hypothetical protein